MGAKGNIEAVYPLTPVQDGILFHTLYAPESPLYFQQYSCIIEGDLDVDVFRRSWDLVIGRHQALRSLLTWEKREQPLQIVRSTVEAEWRIEDWTALAEPNASLEAFLAEDRSRGFDLAVAPLMRLALFDLGQGRHRFIWSHHHIVVDGWSMGIVLDEVFRVYEALATGREPDLAAPADYRGYVNWLRHHDDADAEPYWRDLLGGITAATRLRIESSSVVTPWAEHHAEEIVTVPAALTADLAEAARANGLTMNTLLRGAWALLLNRYSGEDDIVFGATNAGRPPGIDGVMDMVGMFINTLPVRVRMDESAQLIDWLQAIQRQQHAASAHEATPLVQVQGWSDVPKGDPLFSTILVFENVPIPDVSEGKLRTSEVRYLQRSNYPLAVLVMPQRELELIFLYDTDRFDPGAIQRMARQLEHVLAVMAADLSQPVGGIDILLESQSRELLVDWNDTATDFPEHQTMHELIVAAAAPVPDRAAVTDGNVTLTYGELLEASDTIAAQLQRVGVKPNARVGVCMDRSPAMIVAILGVLRSGGAYVPMDPGQPQDRLEYLLADTGATAVVVGASGGSSVSIGHDRPTLEVDRRGHVTASSTPTQGTLESPAPTTGPDDLAYVLFTSGSTGRPKGVAVTHRNLVNSTHVRRDVYGSRVGGFLLVSPLVFDSSLVGLFWTLYDAGTIVLPAPKMEQDVRHLAALVELHRVTHTLALPTLYEFVLEHAEPHQLDSLLVVMVAGEACAPSVVDSHFAALPEVALVNEYGPTEATVWCSAHFITPADGADGADSAVRRVPIGKPIPNTQIFILDPELRPVPVGVPGELCVAGAGLTQGYLGHPELTAQQFVNHDLPGLGQTRLYRTGDIARYLPDGSIDLLGRLDHQVKIRGQRIELSEIETTLRTHPLVRDAAAVVRISGTQPTLVAYADTGAAAAALRTYLADRLPDVMVPAVVVPLDALPHGATGKVDRNALPEPDIDGPPPTGDAIAPAGEVQVTLASIWAEVLGVETVGATDNFFELGGDSILSIRIIARAHEAGLSITPRQFFELPTVAELAAAIS